MKNIVLIGSVAAGKTSVGRMLANKLNKSFFDLDQLIEEKLSLSIREIFELYGEKYFRALETQILERVIHQENAIISTGAGIVLNPYHRELIQKNSYVIHLQVDLDNQLIRIQADGSNRPLLNVKDKQKVLQELHRIRHPLYLQIANISLDTSQKTVEDIMADLMAMAK